MSAEIKSVSEAVELGLKFRFNWWRGQSKNYELLRPKIFRKKFFDETHQKIDPKKEFEIIYQFQRLAPTISKKYPKEKETLKWLILMQHYGAPTRLLDWTENILVGLFFAAQNEKKDGELWSVYPQKINAVVGLGENFPLESHPIIKFLSNEALFEDKNRLADESGLKLIPESAVAFYPTVSFDRMNSQKSVFTIHPTPKDKKELCDVVPDDHLKRFVVPAEHKEQIIYDLKALGINFRHIFNDLESLSKDIESEFSNAFRLAWGQPE